MALIIDAPRVKNCGDCIGYYRCKGWTDEPYSCPIIGEIPDKHGRLIDADELEGILDEVNGYGGASEITYKKMIEILHDETLSRTIVEATE